MYIALGVIYLIVSLAMAAVIGLTTVHSIKTNGALLTKKNLIYLAPTFLIIYLLHITAAVFNGEELDFFYCFSLIYTTLDILKFRAVKSMLVPICKAYPIYYVDFVLAFIIAGVTVIMSVASFFCMRINNTWRVHRSLKRKCDIVIGDSNSAVKYAQKTPNCILLGVDVSGQRFVDLLKQGIYVLRAPLEIKLLNKILRRGGYNIIAFRDGKYSYTKVIETFMGLSAKEELGIYLEANLQEMKILKSKFIKKADCVKSAYIAGFNKYELSARRFVVDHAITKYIPRSFYNENYSLKNNKKIRMVFIGFGKVNYQIFRMCAMQYQFAKTENNKLVSYPVEYYMYDGNEHQLHNEFFSKLEYEMNETFADCDFEKPDKVCNIVDAKELDINSIEAKKLFKSLVEPDCFTSFVISLEDDLQDASYAQTIMRLLDGCDENYRIFVRAKNNNGERLNEFSDRIVYFGEERKLYTHENIVNDDLTELAQRINLFYNSLANPPAWLTELKKDETKTAEEKKRELDAKLADPENRILMRDIWGALPNIEQESNLYHALNLTFKLNMLGFDMVKKRDDNDVGISEEEFNARYKNSGRDSDYSDYSFFFKTESSNVLAFIEHARWNALYIMYDYRQMKQADLRIEESVDEHGKMTRLVVHKNTDLKQHACLTSYYGMRKLIELKYAMLNPDEKLTKKDYVDNPLLQEQSKIYTYDYMDLDRLYGEITTMGYKLVANDKD